MNLAATELGYMLLVDRKAHLTVAIFLIWLMLATTMFHFLKNIEVAGGLLLNMGYLG